MRVHNVLLVGVALTSVFVEAQWLSYPDARTPRTKDGKPNLTAPVPRSADGKIDLSGVWKAEVTPLSEYRRVLGDAFTTVQVDLQDVSKYAMSVFWGIKREEQPLRPEAVELMGQRARENIQAPGVQCLPAGVPTSTFAFAFKMIQAPREIVVLLETGDPARQIYTDGRPLPEGPMPSWMGYSVGKWDGDTLVVETTGFNERSWLDGLDHPRSTSMRITERYHRRDFGHMDLEIAFDDPKYYTRPFGLKTELNLIPDSDVIEYVCGENEKDQAHIPHN
jgi:hypothetical protein